MQQTFLGKDIFLTGFSVFLGGADGAGHETRAVRGPYDPRQCSREKGFHLRPKLIGAGLALKQSLPFYQSRTPSCPHTDFQSIS